MIAAGWAALAGSALFWLGDQVNRRIVGWLPDDPPRPGRKQHARPIPLAGVLLLPAMAPWLVAAKAWWALAALTLAAFTGLVDDRGKEHGTGLDWRWKALGLGLASAAAATACCEPTTQPWYWLALVVFTFALTNATNFLDNTDGVSASLAAVTLLAVSGGHGPAGAAGFAALAFVPWNWPWPRLFLGDAGAYTLGVASALAVGPLLRSDWHALGFVAVQFADLVQVVAARLWLGLPPWVGDRRHLTHIVQNLGLPRVWVAPLFAALAFAGAQLAS
jgi:UDP-GlcNAc:undecaprenyl-phosphate/decaprenyl-phosphate GlcNAc-1-phosphate transferase